MTRSDTPRAGPGFECSLGEHVFGTRDHTKVHNRRTVKSNVGAMAARAGREYGQGASTGLRGDQRFRPFVAGVDEGAASHLPARAPRSLGGDLQATRVRPVRVVLPGSEFGGTPHQIEADRNPDERPVARMRFTHAALSCVTSITSSGSHTRRPSRPRSSLRSRRRQPRGSPAGCWRARPRGRSQRAAQGRSSSAVRRPRS